MSANSQGGGLMGLLQSLFGGGGGQMGGGQPQMGGAAAGGGGAAPGGLQLSPQAQQQFNQLMQNAQQQGGMGFVVPPGSPLMQSSVSMLPFNLATGQPNPGNPGLAGMTGPQMSPQALQAMGLNSQGQVQGGGQPPPTSGGAARVG